VVRVCRVVESYVILVQFLLFLLFFRFKKFAFIMVRLYCFFFTMFQVTDASFKQVIERILTNIVLPWSPNDSSCGRVKKIR
jgi:hypothetical protein